MARLDKSYSSPDSNNEDVVTQLLPANSYKIREAGLEFFSERKVELYTEMHLQVEHPETKKVVEFRGVVVGCTGNKQQGYQVSLAYTNITKEVQFALYEMYWAQM